MHIHSPVRCTQKHSTGFPSPEPTDLFLFPQSFKTIFSLVIKIFPFLPGTIPVPCLSFSDNIICSVALDFWKETAGMLSAPSHTSNEKRKSRGCDLLEGTKWERKCREKNINYKNFKKLSGHILSAPLYRTHNNLHYMSWTRASLWTLSSNWFLQLPCSGHSSSEEKGSVGKCLQKAQEFARNTVTLKYRPEFTYSTSQPSWSPFWDTLTWVAVHLQEHSRPVWEQKINWNGLGGVAHPLLRGHLWKPEHLSVACLSLIWRERSSGKVPRSV